MGEASAQRAKKSERQPFYMKLGLIPRAYGVPDFQAREIEDNGGNFIEGHPAVFDQATNIGGMFNEVIRQGAFAGCDFSDVLLSTNHDLDKLPLARSRHNNQNSTMQLSIDEMGLFIRATLDLARNSEASTLYSAVDRGDISGMSFIFRIGDQEWIGLDTDMPTRYINRISQVIEVSAVSWPAYPGTDIDSRDAYALDSAKRVLDSARKAAGLDSPEKRGEQTDEELELLRLRAQAKILM